MALAIKMDNFSGFYIYCLVFMLVGIFVTISYIKEKKRSEALRLAAQSLGLTFEKKGNPDIVKRFGHFHLFSKGRAKMIMNRIYGEISAIDVMVFGYRCTVVGGKSSTIYMQTVASFSTDKMNLPGFELRPENLFHKIGGLFGYNDIDFDIHSEFSKFYLLRGSDETKIRSIF